MKVDFKRIIISRPDRIGDVVLATPLPREIKKQFPNSYVAVLLRKYTRSIFENNPYVDDIIIIDDDYKQWGLPELFREAKRLRKYHFNNALMLLPDEKINYLFFLAGIKNRIGVGYKFYQFITGVRSVSRNKYKPLRHEADYCLDLARKIGVTSFNYKTEIHLTPEEKEKALEIRKEFSRNGEKLIGINITSGNSCPNLSVEAYLHLIEELKKSEKIKIVITDKNAPEGIVDGKKIFHKSENIRELIMRIKSLDLLISSSTGPSHIAAALEIPTLTFFCRLSACSPQLWSPMGNIACYIQPSEEYCQTKCPSDPKSCDFSEGGIEINQVIQGVKRILKI